MVDIKAVIGLGNPGPKFRKTRHNVGFLIVDELADQYGGSWHKANSNLEVAEINIDGKNILLLKPQTFMNSSGLVIPYLTKKGIKPENILVVHDELEFKFGKIASRLGGSARGHNGLRSIISTIGPEFWRLRVGIGRPEDGTPVGDYVLQPFRESDQELADAITSAIEKIISTNL